jgi:hypothetical protein
MKTHERKQTAFLIDGYFFPMPGEALSKTFERAKEELLRHLKNSIALVEEMTEDQFKAGKDDLKEVDGEV